MFYEHLWFNPEMKIDKRSVLLTRCEQGVKHITDFYEDSNELLSYTEVKNIINTIINLIQNLGLTKAVYHYQKKKINNY